MKLAVTLVMLLALAALSPALLMLAAAAPAVVIPVFAVAVVGGVARLVI